MKKLTTLYLVLLIVSPSIAQNDGTDLYYVDHQALTVNARSPKELSQKLTKGYPTDIEKTRAIFRWITGNIAYRTNLFRGKKDADLYAGNDDENGELKPLDERVAEVVLKSRVALCDGYARLFKTLCDYAGIRSEVVHGYARTETFKRIQRFRSNHAWNAVYLDSSWHLLDVTWASGFLDDRTNDFVKHFDEQYFLTKPENFIREHYPDEIKWTLMKSPPVMPEFHISPFRQRAFTKYLIESYWPKTGFINAGVGDTLYFELTSASSKADERISPDPFLDQSSYHSQSSALLKPLSSKNDITRYRYVVMSASTQWIYLLYNDDLILRYRLNVRPSQKISILAALD